MKSSAPSSRDPEASVLGAALTVFGRDGFAAANVDDIARHAGVAKPTLYNRFGDKRRLFTEAMRFGMARANERVLNAILGLDPRPSDLRTSLMQLGLALVHCVATDEGAAVIRLQIAEQAQFPEIDGMNHRERHIDALAGKLAQLTGLGALRPLDPQMAARQFFALVTSEALIQSGHGARMLPDNNARRLVEAGVDTFLAAFGLSPSPHRQSRKPAAR